MTACEFCGSEMLLFDGSDPRFIGYVVHPPECPVSRDNGHDGDGAPLFGFLPGVSEVVSD